MARIILIAAAMLLFISGCTYGWFWWHTSPSQANKALTGAGYHDIQITGYRFFGCGQDDSFHTGFTAKGPTNVPVSGVVCGGWFKGSTIRTD